MKIKMYTKLNAKVAEISANWWKWVPKYPCTHCHCRDKFVCAHCGERGIYDYRRNMVRSQVERLEAKLMAEHPELVEEVEVPETDPSELIEW